MAKESKHRPWRASVRAAHAEYGDGGFAICAPATTEPDTGRPLLIIIHPGDAVEDGVGFHRPEDANAVIEYGRKNVLAMASEITERLQDHDVVILHRLSSVDTIIRPDFGQSPVEAAILPYQKACLRASDIGTVLYGDHLDRCAEWLVAHLHATSRPHVFMTGAYSEADNGCITYIGKKLIEAGCRDLTVSEHAPPDNCGDMPRWDYAETIAFAKRVDRGSRP